MGKRAAGASVPLALGLAAPLALGALIACSGTFRAEDPTTPDAEAGAPEVEGGTTDVGIALTFPGASGPSYVTQGRDGEIPVEIARKAGSGGAITLTITGLPKDATADPVVVEAGQTKGRLLVRASSKAVQGPFTLEVDALESGGAKTRAVRPAFVRGLPGSLDTTFAAAGVLAGIYAPNGTGSADDAIENVDGSILVVGQRSNPDPKTALARLTATGGRDASFAGGGVIDLASSQVLPAVVVHDQASALKGTIDVMGGGVQTIALFRFLPGGTPLAAFNGGSAPATVPALSQASGQQIAAQPDGKTLLLAKYQLPAPGVFAVSRWTTGGVLDGTYGVAGVCEISPANTGSNPGTRARMFVRPDGSARVVFSLGNTSFAVKGCTAGGVLDTTIGTAPDHFVLVGTGNLVDAAPTADGFVVLSTKADESAQWRRVNAALAADMTIGLNGDVSSPVMLATSIVVQAGAVLVGGSDGASYKVVRHLANGNVDTAFGQAGTLTIPVAGTNTAELHKLVAQRDGRILAVGTQFNTADGALARFWP